MRQSQRPAQAKAINMAEILVHSLTALTAAMLGYLLISY